MLIGIPSLLTGELLRWLDDAGHGDGIALVDAHFPHSRGRPSLAMPGVSLPQLTRAVCAVLPLDPEAPPALMRTPDGLPAVQAEALAEAGVAPDAARVLDRTAFYDEVSAALLVVRTGESRPYGNLVLVKGLAPEIP